MVTANGADTARIVEPFTRCLVFGQFNCPDQANRTGFTHDGVIGKAGQGLVEVGAELCNTFHQLFILDDFDVAKSNGRSDGMAVIGHAMVEITALVEKGIEQCL